jgi:nucleoside-diphosphate-sugar epimerase
MFSVTGGEGHVGPETARRLVEAGHRVRLLVSNPAEGELVDGPGREIVAGDRISSAPPHDGSLLIGPRSARSMG